jgi:hypothetical protein
LLSSSASVQLAWHYCDFQLVWAVRFSCIFRNLIFWKTLFLEDIDDEGIIFGTHHY